VVSGVRTIALPTYEVTVTPGALDHVARIAGATGAHRHAVITDDNVGPLYAARVRDSVGAARTIVLTVPAGEAHKTRETWARLTDELLSAGFGRDSLIIALGGGVVGDVAGFVAATYMRGIPYIQVPTTLLAMVDASIGGKTGVDTPAGKNLVGAFHQPVAVVADPSVLATLPRAHLRAGFAEVIKHGAIADEAYLDRAVAAAADLGALDPTGDSMVDLVSRSIEIKADIVSRDEREQGDRVVLNYGHTFAHAIELVRDQKSGGQAAEDQGEAVALGLMAAAHLAFRQGRIPAEVVDAHRRLLTGLGLPVQGEFRLADLEQAWMRDKKYRHGVRFVVLNALGRLEGGVTADADTLDGALHDLASG